MAGKANRRGFGYLRKLPSKRWQASYYGPDMGTHRAPKTFDYKGDAEGWLATDGAMIQAGTWTPPKLRLDGRGDAVSFEAYAKTWLRDRRLATAGARRVALKLGGQEGRASWWGAR